MPEENNEEALQPADAQEYTRQDVINQSLVAFGQGTQFMRVSSRACREFVRLMEIVDQAEDLHEDWGTTAVQILERVRSIGRVACAQAVAEGETVIIEDYVGPAFRKVQLISKTNCSPTAKASFP